MKITQATEFKDRLIKNLMKRYSSPRDGIHVSDLTLCLRETYFRRVSPTPLTETDLNFFLDGSERHQLIENLSEDAAEVNIEWNGVTGTVDILAGSPVELKTTRATNNIPPHYIRQLSYYVAMMNGLSGYLLIQRINNRDSPFEIHRLDWTKEEMASAREEITTKKELLLQAIKSQTPNALPKADLDTNWKCRYCKYQERCQCL